MNKPMAFKVRPQTIDDIIGQKHLLGEDQVLRNLIDHGTIPSMIFFGPPGTGKTTTAMAIASSLGRPYRLFNAVTDNKKTLDALFVEAKMSSGLVVIIDEVHRLNKDKQDVLLPHIESGLITMIGATTANPYFAINPAIRSRVHLFEFKPLNQLDIHDILERALTKSLIPLTDLDDRVYTLLATRSNGDARYALNALEIILNAINHRPIMQEDLERVGLAVNISMDRDSDNHYDAVSAFQKSIRGSDVDAALYYLAKLIQVGDMDSIERRLIATVYEDIGLANPALCSRVVTAIDAAKRIGFPEAKLPLSVAVIEAALSPKSKSGEAGIDKALDIVSKTAYQVPSYLRLNPVNVDPETMYDYGRSDLWHRIQYLPDALRNEVFYAPQNLNSAEKTYASNYENLKQYSRSSDLKELKNKK